MTKLLNCILKPTIPLKYILNVKKKSTKTKSSSSAIKNLNYENKILFGPVKRKVKGTPEPPKDLNNSKSSEQYWLLQNHKTKPTLKPNQSDVTIDNNILEATDEVTPATKDDSVERERQAIIDYLKGPIPFKDKDLKELLRFPLICKENESVFEYEKDYDGNIPSVGKILQATMSETSRRQLIKWKVNKIAELGEEGFYLLRQEHLTKGTQLHKALENYFKLQELPHPDSEVYPTWKSIDPVLKQLNPKVELTEAYVEHPLLKYRGIVDCVSTVSSNLSVIEWKKSDKPKPDISRTFDAPLQLVAYLGALSADPNYKMEVKNGYLAVAYTNGKPGELFKLDNIALHKYWFMWLHRLQEYWIRIRDGTLPAPI